MKWTLLYQVLENFLSSYLVINLHRESKKLKMGFINMELVKWEEQEVLKVKQQLLMLKKMS
jgi:hypothetical protein